MDLYKLVRRSIPTQGEFEKTVNFEERLNKALVEIRISLVKEFGTGRVIIEVPIGTKYEPDKEFFEVRLGVLFPTNVLQETRYPAVIAPGYETIPVENRRIAYSEYDAQNAFGAKATVDAENIEEYGVALLNLRMAKSTSWLKANFVLQMTPEQAEAIRGKISLLIVGELTSPGIIDGLRRFKPTLQNPRDKTVEQRYVTLNAACGGIVARDSRMLLRSLN